MNLLFDSNNSGDRAENVGKRVNEWSPLSENYTSGIVWRVRIVAPPKPAEFDEYDVRRFRVGEVYEVPARLASLLILGGYAESTGSGARVEAADMPRKPSKR